MFIRIVSNVLGSGKTTLLNYLINDGEMNPDNIYKPLYELDKEQVPEQLSYQAQNDSVLSALLLELYFMHKLKTLTDSIDSFHCVCDFNYIRPFIDTLLYAKDLSTTGAKLAFKTALDYHNLIIKPLDNDFFDIVIFINTPIDKAYSLIHSKRGRDIEHGVTKDFLRTLNSFSEKYVTSLVAFNHYNHNHNFFVIDNNGSLDDLKSKFKNIVMKKQKEVKQVSFKIRDMLHDDNRKQKLFRIILPR